MSEENVEIVRRLFEGWSVGDFTVGIEAIDPHVLFLVHPPFPEAGIRVGPEGISEYLLGFLAQWERFTVEATELRAVGDTVLARVIQRAKGRASGIEGEASYYMLFTLRGRKLVRMDSIVDEAEALEAAGLSE